MARQKALREFDAPKAVAAIGYLVEETDESLYPVMKMLYLADKRHLQEFGRFIAGDEYCAMQQGPVASCAYDMMKRVKDGLPKGDALDVALDAFEYLPDHQIKLRHRPDIDELSESEVSCLQAIVAAYKDVGKWAVREMSHDDAWKEAWDRRGDEARRGGFIDRESIAKTLDNSDVLIPHLRDKHPGEAKLR